MRRIGKIMLCVVILVISGFSSNESVVSAREAKPQEEIESFLKAAFDKRAKALIDQNIQALAVDYLPNKWSNNAYSNEKRRTHYVNVWSSKRLIRLVKAESEIRLIRVKINEERATVSLVQSLKVSYDYLNRMIPVQSFGVGTRHFMTLEKKDGKWLISREWYLDPLDENVDKIAEISGGSLPFVKSNPKITEGKRFNRQQALAYANKYAGAAWGAGNNHRYNQNYLDYTSRGGDCTNFASQVIGDKKAGGLPMTHVWRSAKSGGTQSWVRTDSFSHFILNSGYGKLVSKGDFQHIVSPTKENPNGAVSQLLPGDLIGYIIEGNDVDHFSVIVGHDDYGYPLVNSHTADRYRVPFDLGWDKYTKYLLIHIRD
ncbi:putative amidase domain protein [compost metagenome]